MGKQPEFKVGDKVRVDNDGEGELPGGTVGVITNVDGKDICIHVEGFHRGHDGGTQHCNDSCWWLYRSESRFTLIEREPEVEVKDVPLGEWGVRV